MGTILPFGSYTPDITDYEGTRSQAVNNVLPRADGYGPRQDFQAFTQALPGPCRGLFYARKTDGSIAIFAATATDLYLGNNTDYSWTKVSKAGGPYSALSGSAQWQFAQFGNLVIAVQQNTVPQVYDLTSSSAFADLAGSPPQAAYISVVNFFVVLSGLLSTPYRIQWSALNNATGWTAGLNQSDFQDFPDGGIVRGVAGGEYGVVFQDTTIRQMTYAAGSSYIFQFTRIAEDKGLYAPYALIRGGDRIFFPSAQGFMMMIPGAELPTPIGKEQVDRTFFADIDQGSLQLMLGAPDPDATRVYWAYKSLNGRTGLFDKILCYDWALQRWAPATVTGEFLSTLAKPGLTLENLDQLAPGAITISNIVNNGSGNCRLTVSTINLPTWTVPPDGAPVPTQLANGAKIDISGVVGTTEANGEGRTVTVIGPTTIDINVAFVNAYVSGGTIAGPLDAMTLSLDSYAAAAAPSTAMASSLHQVGFFTGPALEATMESAEKGDIGRRIFVRGFRPVTDAPACFGSISQRENLQATRVYSGENAINAQGLVPARVSTRYARGKIRVPYGTTWTFAAGIEPDVGEAGLR